MAEDPRLIGKAMCINIFRILSILFQKLKKSAHELLQHYMGDTRGRPGKEWESGLKHVESVEK